MSQPRRVRTPFAVLLVLTLAGCTGAGPDLGEPTPTPTTTSTTPATEEPTTPDDPTTPTPSTTSPTAPATVDAVAYVPWGPADPVIPEHYGRLAQRDCDAAQAVSPTGDFWTVVYAVCRSLTKGDAWPDVSTAPDAPDTESPHEQCLNAELAQMVDAALSWHADNPNAQASEHVDYAETGSPCYTTVYSARQLSPDEDFTGPGPGEVTVAVVVDSTWDLASVSVDGSAVEQDAYQDDGSNNPEIGTRTVNIHVAAPEQASQISLELGLSQNGADRGTASTTVDLSPTGDASVSPDDAASPPDGSDGSDGSASSESAGADGS